MYQNSLDVHVVLKLINVSVYSVIHFKVLIIRNRLFGFMITILGGINMIYYNGTPGLLMQRKCL